MIMLILVGVLLLCILNSYYGFHQSYTNIFINYHKQLNYRINTLSAVKPVTVSFEPSGKSIISEQGALIADVAKKAGVTIPYGCRQGRCNSCEVRLNGRVSVKVCQEARIPSGPTKNLIISVVNKQPLK